MRHTAEPACSAVTPGQEVAYYIQVVTTKGRDSDYSPTTRLRL